jgi:hypothetical protein
MEVPVPVAAAVAVARTGRSTPVAAQMAIALMIQMVDNATANTVTAALGEPVPEAACITAGVAMTAAATTWRQSRTPCRVRGEPEVDLAWRTFGVRVFM